MGRVDGLTAIHAAIEVGEPEVRAAAAALLRRRRRLCPRRRGRRHRRPHRRPAPPLPPLSLSQVLRLLLTVNGEGLIPSRDKHQQTVLECPPPFPTTRHPCHRLP